MSRLLTLFALAATATVWVSGPVNAEPRPLPSPGSVSQSESFVELTGVPALPVNPAASVLVTDNLGSTRGSVTTRYAAVRDAQPASPAWVSTLTNNGFTTAYGSPPGSVCLEPSAAPAALTTQEDFLDDGQAQNKPAALPVNPNTLVCVSSTRHPVTGYVTAVWVSSW